MSSTFGGNLGSSPETEYNFSYKLVKINSSTTYSKTILGKLKFSVRNYLIIKEKHGVSSELHHPTHTLQPKKKVWPKRDPSFKKGKKGTYFYKVLFGERKTRLFFVHVFKTMQWHTNKALIIQIMNVTN